MYAVVHEQYVEYWKARPELLDRSTTEVTMDLEAIRGVPRLLKHYVVLSIRPNGGVEVFCRADQWREPDAREGDRVDGVPGKEPGWPEAFRSA